MSRIRLGLTLLAALTLGVLGPAAAGTQLGPKYGGTLVVGLGADPGTLDPTVSGSTSAVVIYRLMCQRLYAYGTDLKLRPLLAAAVPVISKDKLSYTIQLRKGARFNDGTPFNAQAVVATVERYMTYPGSTRSSDYAAVDSVTATGPYTVVYHLKARDSTFAGLGPFVLSPTQLAKVGANFGADPVCVGPFMFDHRVTGDHVTLIKSPYYYDRQNVYLDKIVYKPFPDAPSAAAALKAGDIQVLDSVSTTELSGIRQSLGSLRVLQHPQLGWQGIVINIGNKNGRGNLPYANDVGTPLSQSAKLRQAFEEAIDRSTLVKVVFAGLTQPSCTQISPANTLWYEATKIPCTPYSPKDARKLVATSGFPNPTVHLLATNTTDDLRLAQFIQAQEAAVGINVVIDSTDNATASARRTAGNFDTALSGSIPGNVDPNGNVGFYVATSGVRNVGGYSNPRMDLLMSNGLKATELEARSTLYRVAQQLVSTERPIIPLFNGTTFIAFSTSVAGVQLTGTGNMDLENARYK